MGLEEAQCAPGLPVSELIFITSHLHEQVEEYVQTHSSYPSRFIEQKVQDGTASAGNLARRVSVLVRYAPTGYTPRPLHAYCIGERTARHHPADTAIGRGEKLLFGH